APQNVGSGMFVAVFREQKRGTARAGITPLARPEIVGLHQRVALRRRQKRGHSVVEIGGRKTTQVLDQMRQALAEPALLVLKRRFGRVPRKSVLAKRDCM